MNEKKEKIVAKVDNVTMKVVEKESKGGKPYTAVIAVINGKEVQVGFVNAFTEVALSRAGVKFNY